ncbi:hypothetical protein HPB50_010205 [Hyalomma asiaticum]|uniref:Uncharacterized protein n=1 Tax=Hyalomma asiaticum TaxID=266040 RepID=A0ACB7S017_HYAAI|nr:hypothetical protein HPB50_010205 [Hyalomma asiaticum]
MRSEEKLHDYPSDKKFVATVVILLLLVAALSVFYFSGSSSSASVGGGDGSGDEGGGGEQSDGGSEGSKSSGGFVVSSNPPPPPTPKTPATPRRPTKMVITTSPTPDTFQETPHPPRPVPKKREPYHDLLLCTVSHRALFKEMYPPDGYCELLFYTEAYYESNSGQFLGAYDGISFDVFRRQARSATANNKTTYGVSFIFRHLKEALRVCLLTALRFPYRMMEMLSINVVSCPVVLDYR